MFLSVSTTYRPATDLGFLLHKHPNRLHETDLPFGRAYLFYPDAAVERCEAVVALDVDPVGLVRRQHGGGDIMPDQYVNDRPYAASSLLSVALLRLLRTAMAGNSKERPQLARTSLPLEARVTPLPTRGGEDLVRQLFEPLGWTVGLTRIGASGDAGSPYVSLQLRGCTRLSVLLNHLYVLVPVLDDNKHYWVGDDEVAKLLQRGEGWLQQHPARDLIASRYLRHQRSLARAALARLVPEAAAEAAEAAPSRDVAEEKLEAPIRLNEQRLEAVAAELRDSGARIVADLGCGEGRLLTRLVREKWISRLIGLDASVRNLEIAAKRLKLNETGGPVDGRVKLMQGALTYRDRRWADADAVALVEVIEHIDPDRLAALECAVFREARPRRIVVTTPNAEYNVLFPGLATGAVRHPDHRFEWTRAQFRAWTDAIEREYAYSVAVRDIGPVHPEFGTPTQMAVFSR